MDDLERLFHQEHIRNEVDQMFEEDVGLLFRVLSQNVDLAKEILPKENGNYYEIVAPAWGRILELINKIPIASLIIPLITDMIQATFLLGYLTGKASKLKFKVAPEDEDDR